MGDSAPPSVRAPLLWRNANGGLVDVGGDGCCCSAGSDCDCDCDCDRSSFLMIGLLFPGEPTSFRTSSNMAALRAFSAWSMQFSFWLAWRRRRRRLMLSTVGLVVGSSSGEGGLFLEGVVAAIAAGLKSRPS